jgi:hypothetical protein
VSVRDLCRGVLLEGSDDPRHAANLAWAEPAVGAAPAVVQSYVGSESAIGAAFGVTLRWALIAGLVHTLRKAVRARVGPR